MIEAYKSVRKTKNVQEWILSTSDGYYRSLSLNEQSKFKKSLRIIDSKTQVKNRDKLRDYYNNNEINKQIESSKSHSQKKREKREARRIERESESTIWKFYQYFLGDTNPSVPLFIYLIGTLFGIFIGVGMVVCCTT